MSKRSRNTLTIVSLVLALLVVLMELGIIPNLVNYHFWVMVIAYALLVISNRI